MGDFLFFLKKLGGGLILPPGIFIVLLVSLGVYLIKKKQRVAGLFLIIMGGGICALSLEPVSDTLAKGLERPYYGSVLKGDVLVLLGGGIEDGVSDLTGMGFPEAESAKRLITAARLARISGLPIIIAGGSVMGKAPEALILRRVLVDLGVSPGIIFVEHNSRDTRENARFVKEICNREGFQEPVLLTSAIHMKRSLFSFEREGLRARPFPTHFLTGEAETYTLLDYIPRAGSLRDSASALHEYLGLLAYRFLH